jgi:hypothetical protein
MVVVFREGTDRNEGYRSFRGFEKASIRHGTEAMNTTHRTRFVREGECACGLCRSHIYWKRLSREQRRLRKTRETQSIAKEISYG